MTLLELDDDTLLHIFSLLPVGSILSLRQTCKRLDTLSRQRIVWQSACVDQVLGEGFPFPHRDSLAATSGALENLVVHALRLGTFWLSPSSEPKRTWEFQASSGTGVSHVRFLPGHGGRYVATVYKGIWSMISCWVIGDGGSVGPRKLADWAPKSAIFSGFVINSDPDSEATLATALQTGSGQRSIEILEITGLAGGDSAFRSICNIATSFRPIALKGDLIAFSDDAYETVVMNWRNNTFALLKGSQEPMDERFQYNRCLQVVFAQKSILVVRARSVELFPEPELQAAEGAYATYEPIGSHSFGWIDGVSVNQQCDPLSHAAGLAGSAEITPLSILLRAESDDPWASDVHKLEQFLLLPNPAFAEPTQASDTQPDTTVDAPQLFEPPTPPPALTAPYVFPPVRAERTASAIRGFLRCTNIVFGACGTALWIQPRPARAAHLTGYDLHSSVTQISDALDPAHAPLSEFAQAQQGTQRAKMKESLCAAVFAGPLQRCHPELETKARAIWAQPREGRNWTALDYDEDRGRVALGASDGSVTVLDFV
ncbi:hypothetical protein PYCCODRAFT_1446126 [Trametes coccinea BRFM310]|uniref:F-box domain-containing protein n=1 Tax=Trametes coccinea (strain BRFM310) TaxID=1353009 RepID=A0A1Y2IHT4_TRAC3|nr:hypothetical protein PYCCODRAFT_1446126 [Trametes coccinea BRFM310]